MERLHNAAFGYYKRITRFRVSQKKESVVPLIHSLHFTLELETNGPKFYKFLDSRANRDCTCGDRVFS